MMQKLYTPQLNMKGIVIELCKIVRELGKGKYDDELDILVQEMEAWGTKVIVYKS